jgi:hypothetical protein
MVNRHTLLFVLTFISSYIVLSLPFMFGFGYVIEWTSNATFTQKVGAYINEGLGFGYMIKLSISLFIGFIVSAKKNFKMDNLKEEVIEERAR